MLLDLTQMLKRSLILKTQLCKFEHFSKMFPRFLISFLSKLMTCTVVRSTTGYFMIFQSVKRAVPMLFSRPWE